MNRLKVFCVDMTQPNYPVKRVFTNVTSYEEPSLTESVWYLPDGSRVSFTYDPASEEYFSADDTVQANVGDPAPADLLLQKVKNRKIQELETAYNQTIVADFTDTGTGFTFGSQLDDLLNFTMQATDIVYCPEDYPTGTTIYWRTKSNGIQPLTLDQFKGVCKSLRQHLRGSVQKLWNLENQVNQATTVDAVRAITW